MNLPRCNSERKPAGASFAFSTAVGCHLGTNIKQTLFICPFPVPFRQSQRCSIRRTHMPKMVALPDTPSLFTATNRADALLSDCEFKHPSVMEKLVTEQEVDQPLLSRAYGYTLGKAVRESFPAELHVASLTAGLLAGGAGEDSQEELSAFEAWLSRVGSASEKSVAVAELDEAQVQLANRLYGTIMGRTVRLMGWGLNLTELADGLRDSLADGSQRMPMEQSAFDTQFETLQMHAQEVVGESNLEHAERFFKRLRAEADVRDVQGDGYVLCVDAVTQGERGSVEAGLLSTVQVVLRVRLLDGRVVYMPGFSAGKVDVVEAVMDQVEPALAGLLRGMRAGEVRTGFYHPYAACEIVSMFVEREQCPPQAGLVVDVWMKDVI